MKHLFFILAAASLFNSCVVEDRRYPHHRYYHERVVEVDPVVEEKVEVVHPHPEVTVEEKIH